MDNFATHRWLPVGRLLAGLKSRLGFLSAQNTPGTQLNKQFTRSESAENGDMFLNSGTADSPTKIKVFEDKHSDVGTWQFARSLGPRPLTSRLSPPLRRISTVGGLCGLRIGGRRSVANKRMTWPCTCSERGLHRTV